MFVTFLVTYWYRLLITFANSLDPDQARHFVGPDLDPNCLTLIDLEKTPLTTKKHAKFPSKAKRRANRAYRSLFMIKPILIKPV